jgi:hypothetical protein
MTTQTKRMVLSIVAILVLGITFLFGGSAMTVLAAQSSIPGDTLYPIKTSLENTRLSLASSAAARAELQLQFAERRLNETQSLVAEGRFQNLMPVTAQYEEHIQKALAEMELIAESDPALAASLMVQITNSLEGYTNLLGELLGKIPEPVKAELQFTIHSIRGMSGNENSDDDANENVNANTNDNLNVNENLNANTNANDNMNSNTNDNANTNLNDNENANYNDNSNANANMNTNDNANTNLNGNQNDNDDDYGDNDNGNDNSNNDNDNDDDDDNDNDDDDDNGNDDDDDDDD